MSFMLPLAVFIIVIGLGFLLSALANWDWYKGIMDYAIIEGIFGEDAARWACGISGIVIMVIGGSMIAAIKH